MTVKVYKKFKPYGRLTILPNNERYFLLAPVKLEGDEDGMQYWSVVRADYGNPENYSEKLGSWLYGEALTLIVHPTNIAIELSNSMKDIYYWTGEYTEEEEETEDTEVDMSDDELPPIPDYLLDEQPVLDEPVMDDGFPF